MNFCLKIFGLYVMIMVFTFSAADAQDTETWKTITPTDVYYLAKAIDNSLVSMYELTSASEKKRISSNLRPRNVYQKVLSVAEEFNLLHGNLISQANLNDAYNIDMANAKPANVYGVLTLMKEVLAAKNSFTESTEAKTPKTPSDVFQMMRQISTHHHEIAKKKNIQTTWATPEQVYDSVVKNIMPVSYLIAKETGMKYDAFPFPKQPMTGIMPRNVYNLLFHLYVNISKYYTNKGEYDPIILEKMNDCDEISPSDVFDLTQVIAAELKAKSGNKTLDSESMTNYTRWKEGKDKIVPGDVFRLIQYNFILTKRSLEN